MNSLGNENIKETDKNLTTQQSKIPIAQQSHTSNISKYNYNYETPTTNYIENDNKTKSLQKEIDYFKEENNNIKRLLEREKVEEII